MAGASAKKRLETNAGVLERHRKIIGIPAALCFLCLILRLGSFGKQNIWLSLFGFVSSLAAELAAFWCDYILLACACRLLSYL